MTVPVHEDIERIIITTVDCLRYDFSDKYRELYPDGAWFKGTANGTWTAPSHASMLSSLNAPRHGVLDFGGHLEHENILTNTDSYCGSGVVNRDSYGSLVNIEDIDDPLVEPITGDHTIETTNHISHKPDPEGAADLVEEHDLTFFHDWIIHYMDPANDYDDYPSKSICPTSNMTEERLNEVLEHNIDIYDEYVDRSIEKHEIWLDELKDRGLYENTLFMVWGDHGQAVGYPPMRQFGHGNNPTACTIRIPVSFTSPLFDETTINEYTNPRGVDIWPTLMSIMDEAGIDYKEPDHEIEGVDLTTFGGQLYAYTIRQGIHKSGVGDAVSDERYIHLENDFRQLFEDVETGDGHTRSEPIDDDFRTSILDEKRREVRRNRTKLIKETEIDEEHLEALGYL